MRLGDDKRVDIEVVIVLGIGDCRFQTLLHIDRDPLARKLQVGEGSRRLAAALADLTFSRKRIAVDVKKCLESAIANAENNHDLEVDDLIVSEAHVGKGIVMKRFAPAGRGRSGRIMKPFAQLTIVVRQVEATA